jgi:hypothetical protein
MQPRAFDSFAGGQTPPGRRIKPLRDLSMAVPATGGWPLSL